jgi:cytochrome c oxidase subunit 2
MKYAAAVWVKSRAKKKNAPSASCIRRPHVIALDVRSYAGKVFAVLLAIIALGSTALFLSRHWMPAEASAHAPLLDREFHWSLFDSAVLFVAAQLVLAGFVWRSQKRNGDRSKTFPHGVSIAISISVVFIAVELFSAATLGRSAWGAMYDAPVRADTLRVQAMGQQFAFYFRYPGTDGKFGPIHVNKIDASIANYFGLDRANDAASRDDVMTASLALPVNRPVELLLLSQDVIHGFYVRELRIQQDMVPGMEIPVHFTPTKIGKYEIVCTQLCGTGHYRMRAYLEVMSEADFEEWLEQHAD